MIFEHLSEREAERIYNDFLAAGLSADDAFNETYAIDCAMDEDQEE